MSKIVLPCILTRIKDGDTICVQICAKLPFINFIGEISVRLEGVWAREIRTKDLVEKALGHEDKAKLINLTLIGGEYLLEMDFPPVMTLDRFVGRLKTVGGIDINNALIYEGVPGHDAV